jgi:hypothetical protein
MRKANLILKTQKNTSAAKFQHIDQDGSLHL